MSYHRQLPSTPRRTTRELAAPERVFSVREPGDLLLELGLRDQAVVFEDRACPRGEQRRVYAVSAEGGEGLGAGWGEGEGRESEGEARDGGVEDDADANNAECCGSVAEEDHRCESERDRWRRCMLFSQDARFVSFSPTKLLRRLS